MSKNIGNVQVKLSLDAAAYEQGIKSALGSMNILSTALGALGIGFGAVQIKEFITDMSQVSVEMDGLTNKFNAAAGGAQYGASSMQFVRDEAQRLGLVFESTAISFSGFEAAALRSGLTMNETKEIFDNIARAATSLHLTGEKTELVFLALEQMASKGVVSMEELRRQLGDALPGAFEIAAKSMGVSTAAFNKMVSDGKVMSADFLPKFARAVRDELGGEAEKAATQANAAFNRYQNAIFNISDAIGDSLNPSLAELATNATGLINGLNEDIRAFQEWAAINQEVVGGIKDASVAIAALSIGIPLASRAIQEIITFQNAMLAGTKLNTLYQAAFSMTLKNGVIPSLFAYKLAIQNTVLEIKALTLAMLGNPITWVTLILGTGAAAWWLYQQNVKSTVRAIEDLNAAQDQNVDKTVSAIQTLKELGTAKNLDYDQTKRLEAAISYLTEKYPNYIGKLQQELKLKGEISKATAEQIANEMTLAKVKGLQEARIALNKDMQRDMFISNILGKNHAGGRYGITKSNQKRDDSLNAERAKLETERKAIIEDLAKINQPSAISGFNNSPVAGKGKTAKQLEAEEKRRQKEMLDYKIALLDVEKYETIRTEEEIYQLELKQANLRIASAKKGTSEYAQALAAKLKLERDHEAKLKELKSQQLVDTLEYNKQELDSINSNLELEYQAGRISKVKMLELEIENINKKKELERAALAEQLSLIAGNTAEEVKIKRASNREIEQLERERRQKAVDLQSAQRVSFKEFTDEISMGWGNTVSDIIKGDADLSDAFNAITDTMFNAFGNYCGKMVETWLENHLMLGAISKTFAIQKVADDAAIIGSNTSVALSNDAIALSSMQAASAQTGATSIMETAASGFGAVAKLVTGPIQDLAGAMLQLALSSAVVAVTMPIIAIATVVTALAAALAALTLGVLNAVMLLTAGTALLFAPISVLLAAEFALIAVTAQIAADAVGSLAIALAAASVAGIPVAGAVLAPMAATTTGAAIMAANAMIQFRESGGPVKRGQAYVVGEKRPELFVPDSNGMILSDTSALNRGAGSGGQIVNHNYNITTPVTIQAIDTKDFKSRIVEVRDTIHSTLHKGIIKRQLRPLGT